MAAFGMAVRTNEILVNDLIIKCCVNLFSQAVY